MSAFSLLLVVLLAVSASGRGGSDNVGSLIRLAVTLVPLSMRGALVVGGSAPSTGADQGQLTLVLPPLLGAVVGLTALTVATSRRVREAPPPTPGPLALEALRTGAAFAALMGLVTLLVSELAADATASASATAPDGVDAAGSPISYSAGNIIDGDPQTAWRAEGNGRGGTLLLTLPSPVHLTRVGPIPGYAKVDPSNGVDRFPENRRVREVRWRFDGGTTVNQRFGDSPTMQDIAVDTTTSSVTIEILSTRPGTPDHDYVPISEVSLVGTTQ